MRAVIQRVSRAKVSVEGEIKGSIDEGLLVLLGVGSTDTDKDMTYIADKLVNMRIFSDADGKMNLSIRDIGGKVLLISQFTLYGDCSHGRRPYFGDAMEPNGANELYEKAAAYIESLGISVETGVFGADMQVSLTNDGPVTIILDSNN